MHCHCREDIDYRCPMHATNWKSRATAAEAENARLVAALHCISLGSQNSGTTKEDLGREARAALEESRNVG